MVSHAGAANQAQSRSTLMARLRPRTTLIVAMVAASLVVVSGCGDGKPWVDTSMTEATVTGIVSVKGTPADGGVILFNANNTGRTVPIKSAPIGKDGSYKITTYVGVNQVSFNGEIATKNRGVGLVKDFCEVKAGENKADFDLLTGKSGKQLPFDVENPPTGKAAPKRIRR
jgi:hypothetical protein